MNHPESQLQRAVAELLDHLGWRWCHVPNGGKRNTREAARFRAEGVKPGVPDVIVFEDWMEDAEWPECGFGVAIELKSPKGKPTKVQQDWLDALGQRGWSVAVCRSLDDVIAVLRLVRPINGRRMK